MLQKLSRGESKSIAKYLVVGVCSFATEYASFVSLTSGLGIDYRVANIISVLLAFVVNFLLNRYFVFEQSGPLASKNTARQLSRYSLLVGFNIIASTTLIGWLLHLGVASYIAKLIAIVMTTSWTYILYKKVIFTHQHKDTQ
jgi:putative flippase GtrA